MVVLSVAIPVQNKSTIITAPPKFTSGLHCPTTLLELIEDVYERQKRKSSSYDVGEVVFYRDIDPLFRRMYLNSWTNFRANEGHGTLNKHSRFSLYSLHSLNHRPPES